MSDILQAHTPGCSFLTYPGHSNCPRCHSLAAPAGSASVLELGHAKSNDAHCLTCGFRMVGGANVGVCPKCGSDRWYRTLLPPNAPGY